MLLLGLSYRMGGTKVVLILGFITLWLGPVFLPTVFGYSLLTLGFFHLTGFTLVFGLVAAFFVASFTRQSERLDETIGSFWSRMFLVLLAFVVGVAITALIPSWWSNIISVPPSNSTVIKP